MIDADWVALYKSRGFESYQHKLFMRATGEMEFNKANAFFC